MQVIMSRVLDKNEGDDNVEKVPEKESHYTGCGRSNALFVIRVFYFLLDFLFIFDIYRFCI